MSIFANYIQNPSNGFTAKALRFVPHFERLRLSWTHNTPKSEGMERFVEEYLPIIRANNPKVEYILHRSHTEWDPFVVGEYRWSRKRKKNCSWKNAEVILAMIEEMAIGGDFRLNREVQRRLPRGQELWDTETMGHDVFKVHSKWKADPPDPNAITSLNHPHLIYKKYHG